MQAKTALVVDDSRVARLTLSKLLQSHGLEVAQTGSAEEALELLQSDSPHPSIIFMDVMMAGMDGISATKQLKSNEKTKHIPVVMCTGNDTDAEKSHAASTGAMAVLSKPASVDALIAILATLEEQVEVAVEVEDITEEPIQAIDEEAIIDAVLARIKAELMPNLREEVTQTVEDISRQIATTTTQDLMENRSASLAESISGQVIESSSAQLKQVAENAVGDFISEQTASLAENITQQAIEAASIEAKQIAEKLVEDSVAMGTTSQDVEALTQRTATEAVENYVNDSLQQKTTQLLDQKGEHWLQQQEAKLSEKVNSEAISTVLAYLETEMEPLVTTVVGETLQNSTQQDSETVSVPKKSGLFGFSLRKYLEIMTGAVIGLSAVVLILIIVLIAS